MSGTAGLAAARRRRAGGAGVQQPITHEAPQQQPPPKVGLNPIQILQQHAKQIGILTDDINTLKQHASDNASVAPATKDDIEFYKEKYTSLLSEISEMKTNFLKMQTFCMDVNMKLERIQSGKTDSEQN